ncbi:MAG: hypothetical protein EBW87_04645, partial [Burkholderiaceae bacterium]|nr:hypothetical protein [Burkholderiaceae bacterium]
NVNYAASKTSTSADSATTPDQLRDGAIGFYTESGTLIPAAGTGMSTATRFFIAQGTSTGCLTTPLLDRRGIKSTLIQDYTAPVLQVSYVGFNGTSGSLQNSTTVKNDTASIKIIETTLGRQVFPKQTFTAVLAASATPYDIAAGLATVLNSTNFSGSTTKFAQAEVVTDGSLANYTMTGTTPTVTFTNGSKVVTLGGTTPTIDVAVGDIIKFNAGATPTNANGIAYKVTAVSAGVSFTLDRAFGGSTQTLTQAEAQGTRLKKTTSITAGGVRLTANDVGKHFRLAVSGVIEKADITYSVPFNPGSGRAAQVLQMEKDFSSYSYGNWNKVGPYAVFGANTLYTDSTATYDLFDIKTTRISPDKSGMDSNIGAVITTVVAIHASATGANSALDTIIAAI